MVNADNKKCFLKRFKKTPASSRFLISQIFLLELTPLHSVLVVGLH